MGTLMIELKYFFKMKLKYIKLSNNTYTVTNTIFIQTKLKLKYTTIIFLLVQSLSCEPYISSFLFPLYFIIFYYLN